MNPFTWLKNQSLFSDRRAVWLLLVDFIGTVFVVLFTLLSIERREFKVPIRYSGYNEGSFSNRGEWYSLYAFTIFAVLSMTMATILSVRIHKLRPELAQTLLALQLVLLFFNFLVARALLNLL